MDPTVRLLTWSQYPLETLYSVWEASRNNDPVPDPHTVPRAPARELFLKIVDAGIPVAENIHFCFLLEGVSIALREQLVRHRIGQKHGDRLGADIVPDLADSTWWAQSMRILDMGTFAAEGRYLIPESADDTAMAGNWDRPCSSCVVGQVGKCSECGGTGRVKSPPKTRRKFYEEQMGWAASAYRRMIAAGMPMEDARNIIPLAACHRLTWSINLAALKHVVGKRGCWILQLGMWRPIIEGMVNELATRIDPAFRQLIAPPCIRGGRFDGCKFKLDNERRIAGEDAIPPCSLYLGQHEDEALSLAPRVTVEGQEVPNAWGKQYSRAAGEELWACNAEAVGGAEEAARREQRMVAMMGAYGSLWGRNPCTGEMVHEETLWDASATPAAEPTDGPPG